jgi:hypothetical protein
MCDCLRGHFAGHDLVYVAPDPVFSGLDRTHDRVRSVVEVFGGMLVLRGIAATDVAAHHAHAEMNPGVAHLYALFANMRVGVGEFDLIQMVAFL